MKKSTESTLNRIKNKIKSLAASMSAHAFFAKGHFFEKTQSMGLGQSLQIIYANIRV